MEYRSSPDRRFIILSVQQWDMINMFCYIREEELAWEEIDLVSWFELNS